MALVPFGKGRAKAPSHAGAGPNSPGRMPSNHKSGPGDASAPGMGRGNPRGVPGFPGQRYEGMVPHDVGRGPKPQRK